MEIKQFLPLKDELFAVTLSGDSFEQANRQPSLLSDIDDALNVHFYSCLSCFYIAICRFAKAMYKGDRQAKRGTFCIDVTNGSRQCFEISMFSMTGRTVK